MPFKRVGKCVHKKYANKSISKKPIGCSDSAAGAKEYLKALYASEMNERKEMSPAEVSKREDIIRGMLDNKRTLVKKYGADAEKVMYGTATSKAKKLAEMESKDKLREIIKKALSKPMEEEKTDKFDDNPALKGKQKTNLPDALQKAIIKKKGGKIEEGDLDLGHRDNEPNDIKSKLYKIGTDAMVLYKMVKPFDEMNQEVDFPSWWQSKVTKSQDYLESAKEYLEFELKKDKIDALTEKEELKESIKKITKDFFLELQEVRRVKQDPDIKKKKGTQPANYYKGLSKSTKSKRDAQFKKQTKMGKDDPEAYKKAPGDTKGKTKPSKYTKKFKERFGEGLTESDKVTKALKNKAKKANAPLSALRAIYNKGLAAWRTGHRPGASQHAWGLARVNSVLTGGKARKVDAKQWAQIQKYRKKKRKSKK